MTDNEIAKTLEYCLSSNYEDCLECPLHNDFYPNLCHYERDKNVLDLINRQKAEIERLKGSVITNNVVEISKIRKTAKSEAIKEFAQRLKEKLFYECGDINYTEVCDTKRVIDNLVKEMTESEENL